MFILFQPPISEESGRKRHSTGEEGDKHLSDSSKILAGNSTSTSQAWVPINFSTADTAQELNDSIYQNSTARKSRSDIPDQETLIKLKP